MLAEIYCCCLFSSALVKMWLFGLLLLPLASLTASDGSECIVSTLKCSRLRPSLNTHKYLFTSRGKMIEMCRQQDRFFKCLDHMVSSTETGETTLPSPLLHAKTLIKDLCLNTSSWQKKLLDLAPCINRQYTEFCTTPEFLGTVKLGDKPRTKCSLREEAVNCIAATLAMNCGMDAGKLFHHLLKMTSDGGKNCYAVGSEILFLPPVKEARDDDDDENMDSYNEVYSNLVRRIGSIPEQDESVGNSLPVAVEALTEDNGPISGMGATMSDDLTEISTSEETQTPRGKPYTIKETEDDVILPPKLQDEIMEKLKSFNLTWAIRFHGNNSISEYFRFPWSSIVEFTYCFRQLKNGKKVHVCTYVVRDIVPICLEGERLHHPIPDPINPEDIDPALGAKLYTMFPYSYPFIPYEEMSERLLKHLRESLRVSHQTTTEENMRVTDSTTRSIDGLYTSIYDGYTRDSEAVLEFDSSDADSEASTVNNGEGNGRSSISENYSSSASTEFEMSDRFKNFVMAMTTLRPTEADPIETTTSSITSMNEKSFDFKRLSREHQKLFALMGEVKWLLDEQTTSPISKVERWTSLISAITIERRANSQLVNATCGRVNECHPNATDIFKCEYYFTSPDDELAEEVTMQSDRLTSHEPSSDEELNTQTYTTFSQTDKVSDGLESVEPVAVLDESYDQRLGLSATEVEVEYSSYLRNNREETADEDPESKSVQFVLLEPEALSAMSSLQEEQVLHVLTEENMDNQLNNSEYSDLIPEDVYSESDLSADVDESLRQNFNLIQSLNELENIITDGLENIQVE